MRHRSHRFRFIVSALAALAVSLAVGSCGGASNPFAKMEGFPTQALLAMPPPEYFMVATAQAAAEVDFETVYGPAAPDLAEPVEPAAEVRETAAEETVDPAPVPEDTADVVPPKKGAQLIKAVAVPKVRGSPGTGNAELTAAMRRTLKQAGLPVIDAPRDDALTIAGTVKLGPAAGAMQKVGLSWTVSAPDGSVLGAIKQLNDIPAGSLDQGWGETAGDVAEAASSGIFDLVKRFH